MKIIITESQYKKLSEEKRVEFPGIDYFNNDWNLVEKYLNKLTFNNKRYSDIDDLKKEYFISEIKKQIPKVEDLNIRDYDNYYGLIEALGYLYPYKRTSPNEFHEFDRLFHDFALISIYDDTNPEDPQFQDNYEVPYKDLDINTLEILYDFVKSRK